MNRLRLAAILLLTSLCTTLALGADRGPSTPEERERAVKITHQLEQDPLNSQLRPDREWLLKWLIEVPDIQVGICPPVLGSFFKQKKYKYSAEIVGQLTFSSAAFAIENPPQASDEVAMYSGGLEGALKAYASILKTDPKARSSALDELAAMNAEQRLAHLRTASDACKQGNKLERG